MQQLGFLGRSLRQCPSTIKENCYKTLVQPIAEYPHTKCNISKVESMQRKAARFVHNNYTKESSVIAMVH